MDFTATDRFFQMSLFTSAIMNKAVNSCNSACAIRPRRDACNCQGSTLPVLLLNAPCTCKIQVKASFCKQRSRSCQTQNMSIWLTFKFPECQDGFRTQLSGYTNVNLCPYLLLIFVQPCNRSTFYIDVFNLYINQKHCYCITMMVVAYKDRPPPKKKIL